MNIAGPQNHSSRVKPTPPPRNSVTFARTEGWNHRDSVTLSRTLRRNKFGIPSGSCQNQVSLFKKKLIWPHPRLSDFLLHLFPRKVMKIQVIGFHRDLVTFSRTSWPQKMSIRSETSSKQLFTEKWFFKNAPVTWWLIPARYAHKKKEIGRGAREKNYKNLHKVHKDLGNEETFTLHLKKKWK